MAWICVDADNNEAISYLKPEREISHRGGVWNSDFDIIDLPKGTIKKLIGRTLTWESEPAELEEIKTTEEEQ